MRTHVIAKCHRWKDPKFEERTKQLFYHGLRGDSGNKDGIGDVYQGYVRDVDLFKYMIKDFGWEDYWTIIYD